MALASWSMMFGSLFFAYAILRLEAGTWPPDGVAPLPRLLPFVNTLVLLALEPRPAPRRAPGGGRAHRRARLRA